jgi:hypothetical protein
MRNMFKKLITFILAVAVAVPAYFAVGNAPLMAASASATTGAFRITLDRDTSSNAKPAEFGTAEGDGLIWTDKSVASDGADGFNITLSALSQQYITTAVSSIQMPGPAADVLLILDTSLSMDAVRIESGANANNRGHESMVKATNHVIQLLQESNPNNRVMATWFGASPGTLLPLGRYRTTGETNNGFSPAAGGAEPLFLEVTGSTVRTARTAAGSGSMLSRYNPATALYETYNISTSIGTTTLNSTPTQAGVRFGIQEMIAAINATPDDGIERIPFVLLLSDGGANQSSNDWWNAPFRAGSSDTSMSNAVGGDAARALLTTMLWKENLQLAYNRFNCDNSSCAHDNTIDTPVCDTAHEVDFMTIGMGADTQIYQAPAAQTHVDAFAWTVLDPQTLYDVIKGNPVPPVIDDRPHLREAQQVMEHMIHLVRTAHDGTAIPAAFSLNTNPANSRTPGPWAAMPDMYKETTSATFNRTVGTSSFAYKILEEGRYVYSDFYTFADSYDKLSNAFNRLAAAVAEATKDKSIPMDTVAEGSTRSSNSAITFIDPIGAGMELRNNGGVIFRISDIDGEPVSGTVMPADFEVGDIPCVRIYEDGKKGTADIVEIYAFEEHTSYVVLLKEDRDYTVKWEISAEDMAIHMYRFDTAGDTIPTPGNYETPFPDPFRLHYGVKMTPVPASANLPTLYFANKFAGGIAGAFAEFSPLPDNPTFFFTNEQTKVGLTDTLANLGYPGDAMNEANPKIPFAIGNFFRGTPIVSVSDGESFANVYITSEMMAFSGGRFRESQIGTLTDIDVDEFMLGADGEPNPKFAEFKAALEKSIKESAIADGIDTGLAHYAFRTGVPLPKYAPADIVNKDTNPLAALNPGVPAYVARCTVDAHGVVTRRLGNNGALTLNAGIAMQTDTDLDDGKYAYPAGRIRFTVTVFNYDDSAKSNMVVRSPLPAITDGGLHTGWTAADFDIKNGGTFNSSGGYIEWTVGNINGEGEAELSFYLIVPVNAKAWDERAEPPVMFPGNGAVYENHAVISSIGGVGMGGSPPKSETMRAGVKVQHEFGVEINLSLDGDPWDGTGSQPPPPVIRLRPEGGNPDGSDDITDLGKVPPGDYRIISGGSDTGEGITVGADRDNEAALGYFTLALSTGAGTSSATGGGFYLAGAPITINVTVDEAGGYLWKDWTSECASFTDTVVKNHSFNMPPSPLTLTANANINKVSVTPRLNGTTWNSSHAYVTTHGAPVFSGAVTIQRNTDTPIAVSLTTGTSVAVPAGTYNILAGGTATGQTLTVTAGSDVTNSYLNYYSLTVIGGAHTNTPTQSDGNPYHTFTAAGSTVGIYLPGATINYSVLADDGFTWYRWSASGNTSGTGFVYGERQGGITMPANSLILTATAKGYEVEFDFKLVDGSGYIDWAGSGYDEPVVKLVRTGDGAEFTEADFDVMAAGEYVVWLDGEATELRVIIESGEFPRYEDSDGEDSGNVIYYYVLTLNTDTGTSDAAGGGRFREGEAVAVSAAVNSGYHWRGWEDNNNDIYNDDRNATITMPADALTLTATAAPNDISVTVWIDGTEQSAGEYEVWLIPVDENGEPAGARIDPNNDDEFHGLEDGRYELFIDDGFTPGGRSADVIIIIGKDAPPSDADVRLDYFTLTVEGDANDGIESVYGGGIFREGDKINISAVLGDGYRFSGWTPDEEAFGEVEAKDAVITMPGYKLTLTATAAVSQPPPPEYTPEPPPATTTVPSVTTTMPSVTTTAPPATTTMSSVTTTAPPVTTTVLPVTTTAPPVTTTTPPVTTTTPERAESGEDTRVYLVFEDISETISQEDKNRINTQLEALALEGFTIGMYLDFTMFEQVGDSNPSQLSELGQPMSMSIEIPAHLRAEGRQFTIVNVRDGIPEIIHGEYDHETGIFTFTLNAVPFGVLLFSDAEAPPTPADDNPRTGISLGLAALVPASIALAAVRKKKD